MKYVLISKDDDSPYQKSKLDNMAQWTDSIEYEALQDLIYAVEIGDTYDTVDLFDGNAFVTIETTEDKDSNIAIADCTIHKNYDGFNAKLETDKDVLIRAWCRENGKSQAQCIKDNHSGYNTEMESIITDQDALIKTNT